MPRIPAHSALLGALSVLGLLGLSGCCGGYSVVRTSFLHRAELRPTGPVEVAEGDTHVLHYSRLGEPPNSCKTSMKYVEDLWIQLPSLTVGQTYSIGEPGVGVAYSRLLEGSGDPLKTKNISGSVTIKEVTSEVVSATLVMSIVLPSGETVQLDDDYAFHPDRPGQGRNLRGPRFQAGVSCARPG